MILVQNAPNMEGLQVILLVVSLGGGIIAVASAGKAVKEYNKKQKELERTKISATIDNIWQQFDVFNGGEKGMNIHVKFQVNNMLNLTGACNAYFYDNNGTPLRDCNQRYCASDGQVSSGIGFSPNYTNCAYNDCVIFMPYNELHVIGQHNIKFKITLFDNSIQCLAQSDYNEFNINWQG